MTSAFPRMQRTSDGERLLSRDEFAALLTQRDTRGAHRFLGMGFTLGEPSFAYLLTFSGGDDRLHLNAPFTCVCGRQEYWGQIIEPTVPLEFQNIYDSIVRFGATSRKHLLADGYTEAQIDDMERRLREF